MGQRGKEMEEKIVEEWKGAMFPRSLAEGGCEVPYLQVGVTGFYWWLTC